MSDIRKVVIKQVRWLCPVCKVEFTHPNNSAFSELIFIDARGMNGTVKELPYHNIQMCSECGAKLFEFLKKLEKKGDDETQS